MPIVCNLAHVDAFNPGLRRLGYEPKGENGIPGRRYFVKGGDASRAYHVHTYEADHPEVARHLDFRDYLIAHPAQARQYANLKVALSRQFPHNIEGYMAGKAGFIRETITLAHQWRARLEGHRAINSV